MKRSPSPFDIFSPLCHYLFEKGREGMEIAMALVKVTNLSDNMSVGLSFKPLLRPHRSTIVEEEQVTDADRRLTKREPALISIEPYKKEDEEAKPTAREIPDPETKPPEEDAGHIITGKEMDEEKAAEEEQPAEAEEETKELGKIWTKEELADKSRDELREIGTPLGVRGRAVEKLIADILEAQEREANKDAE
jgi:hypothetical protein